MRYLSLLPRLFALGFVCVLLMTEAVAAGGFAIDLDDKGVALKGHDPVAYFADGGPTKGNSRYSASAGGAVYYFASAEHRDRFIVDPAKYTAAYGGFCALGVTRSKKVTGDPVVWKVVDGKLYINSSPESLVIWSEDITGNIKTADQAWPAIKDKDPADLY